MKNGYKLLESKLGDIEDNFIRLANNAIMFPDLKFALEFNGVWLYSDIDTLDSAYLKVTGKTKAEFDEYIETQQRLFKEKREKHETEIPDLTKKWIEEGKTFIKPEYQDAWNNLVPNRLADLYQGMELQATKDLISLLDNEQYEEAKSLFYEQGHSGMSASIVMHILNLVHINGNKFIQMVK